MFWTSRNIDEIVRQGLVDLFPRLHRYCVVLTNDLATADDLAQAACTRALERAEQYQVNTHLDRWLFRITQRLWIDELRKQAVRKGGGLVNVTDVDLADLSPDPEMTLMSRQVLRSIFALPEAQRISVLLVYGEGYSYKDAAHILDIPIGTVMSRLAAARQKLAAIYKGHTRAG